MGDFYQVIKTIKGRPYRYKQRTFRAGGKVCTESHYLGPASDAEATRIRAEMALRKGGPSRPAVRRAIARLADPAAAGTRWKKPWDNSSPRRQKVYRIEAFQRVITTCRAVINEADAAYYDWGNDRLELLPTAVSRLGFPDETRSDSLWSSRQEDRWGRRCHRICANAS